MMNQSRPIAATRLLIGVGVFTLGAAGCRCMGQSPALGGGTALDANLQVGSNGINPRGRDVLDAVRFQNAIVTGNAFGGRSFRGNVPYLASDDFRASLGSNDLFAFRRDSVGGTALSGGLLGSAALQYQFNLTTGQTPPGIPANLDPGIIRRSGAGVSSGDIARAMRSTASFEAVQTTLPTIIDMSPRDDGRTLAVTSSPLMGVRRDYVVDPRMGTAAEASKVPGLTFSGLERHARGVTDPLSSALRVPTSEAVNWRVEPISASHRLAMARVDEALLGEDEQAPESIEDRRPYAQRVLDDLRERLAGLEPQPSPDTPSSVRPGAAPGDPDRLAPNVARAIRDGGLRVESFEADATGNRAYAERMGAAQEAMTNGRYFDAEDAFTRALAIAPGDPMASIGRVHAQIGAGMYLSASFNLRQFLTTNPELASVRYAERLMPTARRLEDVRRQLLDVSARNASELSRDGAVLLAYVGFQSGDEGQVETGLARFGARLGPDDIAGRAMLALARAAWTMPADADHQGADHEDAEKNDDDTNDHGASPASP